MSVRVVQSGIGHTGTTPLANLIHGLVAPDSPVKFGDKNIKNEIITKTHTADVDKLMKMHPEYELYFVMAERVDEKVNVRINDKHRSYKNVLVIDYGEILETPEWGVEDIADNLFTKLFKFLPREIIPNPVAGSFRMATRLRNMNARYEEIKHKPFSYYDPFYHIHGSHRGRGDELLNIKLDMGEPMYKRRDE